MLMIEGAVKKKRRTKKGEEFSFLEALVKADFWLLFLVYFCGCWLWRPHGVALLEAASVSCLGPDCFRITFLVLAGVSCLGVVLSIILSIRIEPVYQMLYPGGSFRQHGSSNH
ncbi:hypothetical protein MLD38_005680 [Melastoma candidum]|uniref:Uncharacterized protein n=1 Tax=Melastoma candidum TaxID=119954 RepID=A0ACB9RL01_9MYRT|nr:hypothetical protein MLD38_005680 [Melastoma candidum]